jgi:hypothetical protein
MWIGLTIAIAIATVVLGWWTVPVVSAIWTLAMPRRGGVTLAAFSGATAWGVLLLIVRRDGPVGALDSILSAVLQMPPRAGIALTVLYAAVLAGSAALIAQSLRPPARRRRTTEVSSSSLSR